MDKIGHFYFGLTEVQFIDGPDHNFLWGFFYRLTFKYEKAIEKFKLVLRQSPNFSRAKRELAQVYLHLEDYNSAYRLAKENYENDKKNAHYAECYFRCLLAKKDQIEFGANSIINEILSSLKFQNNRKAQEFYLYCQAQYEAYINNDLDTSINTISTSIERFPNSIYPRLLKMQILRHFNEIEMLEEEISKVENTMTKSDIDQRLPFLLSKIVVFKKKGNEEEISRIIDTKIRKNFPEKVTERIIEKYLNNRVFA